MSDIFLSYSREDQTTARRFAEAFEREGLSVWWDQTLKPGEAYDRVTERALQDAKAVVVLWSKKSVESHWVRSEATQAQSNGTLVPVMIEPCKRPIMFELMHTAELAHWKGEAGDTAWKSFLGDVRQFVKKEGAGSLPAAGSAVPRRRRFGVGTMVGIAALLLVAGVGLWVLGHKRSEPLNSATTEVSLAVLPFANLSSDPEQEYLSDGLTEEILDQLAQIRDLRLIGRTSSFSFKGKNEDPRVIGEQLGVANLLDGSIRKDGNHLRIKAQLINAKDGSNRWSHTYERDFSKVFALQEEIAKDVAEALSVTLDVGELSRAHGGTSNLAAHDKYLRARPFAFKLDAKSQARAVQYYREAVELDPTFGRAWLGLIFNLGPLRVFYPDNADVIERERRDIGARIDSLTPRGWWTDAMSATRFRYEYKWAQAEAADKAAMAAGPPSEFEVLGGHAFLLWSLGRVKESIPYWQRLVEADPLSVSSSNDLASALVAAGRTGEAEVEYKRSKALVGTTDSQEYVNLTRLWFKENADPAFLEAALGKYLLAYPNTFLASLVGKVGNRQAALAVIRKAFGDPAFQSSKSMATLAGFADHYGDRDLALTALRRAHVDLTYENVPGIWNGTPELRADQRFKQILQDMGLVDYFRSSGNWGDFCKPVGNDDFECH